MVAAQRKSVFYLGEAVLLSSEVESVQSPEGAQVPAHLLGPGVVEQVSSGGASVLVRWAGWSDPIWVDASDLRSPGPDSHLVEVYSRNRQGKRTLLRRGVVTSAGLRHNWSVEMLPGDIVRAVRDDGGVWTFQWRWILRRMDVLGTVNTLRNPPPGDDDAEALTVAEIAQCDLDIHRMGRGWEQVPYDI
jgi:hypothetical protein